MSSDAEPGEPPKQAIKQLDQQVINRIAAGEVIHRPSSALKEMLENSLDAGALSIAVTAKGGGLKLLQIQDSGHGILKPDFPRVCERFATSKLKAYEDLESIETFGFRGEALASISHVAHVTITSMVEGSACAYKASFSEGHLVPARPGEPAEPKPCAGTKGTQIVVEDMFYNAPTRLKAMKSAGDEYGRLLQVVQSYAIDNEGVAVSCRKGGESTADLSAPSGQGTVDTIRGVYGAALAKELLALQAAEPTVGLQLRGYVSSANYASKKLVFLLFINKRLVESTALRRAIEEVYTSYLPKHAHPFAYLSLRLPPADLDVNVHPTKREVHLVHQEAVVGAVQARLRELLLGANASRSFYTQAVLPGMTVGAQAGSGREGGKEGGKEGGRATSGTPSLAERKKKEPDPRKLVRGHGGMSVGELDKYVCRPSSSSARSGGALGGRGASGGSESRVNTPGASASPSGGGAGGGVALGKRRAGPGPQAASLGAAEAGGLDEGGGNTGASAGDGGGGGDDDGGTAAGYGAPLRVPAGRCGAKRVALGREEEGGRPWVACELSSIASLLRGVTQRSHRGLSALFSSFSFVGVVDVKHVLLQHLTKLYVVHLGVLSQEFFAQQVLRRWGNLGGIILSTPAPLEDLCLLALQDPRSGWAEADGAQLDLARDAAALLAEKAEMLEEYVALRIDDGGLCSLPQLVDGYVPPLLGLPLFVWRLATQVDWSQEQPCFEGIARQLASFYRVDNLDTVHGSGAGGEGGEGNGPPGPTDADADAAVEDACSEAWTIQHVLLPAIRKGYEPPSVHASNGTVVQVACTEMLYKIFERC